MKKYFYMRLNENYFESDEQMLLESMTDGYLYSNILLKLYLKSLKRDGLLMFNDRIPYNAQMIASITRHQVGTVEKALKIFEQMGIIEILESGEIFMLDVQNFVGKSTTEADRIRAYRTRIEDEKTLIEGGCTNVRNLYTKDRVKAKTKAKAIAKTTERVDDTASADATANLTRHQYGQYSNVLLTDEDIEKLKSEFPNDWEERIERLSEYIASKGAKYKNHLATIRAWARKDKQNDRPGNGASKPDAEYQRGVGWNKIL